MRNHALVGVRAAALLAALNASCGEPHTDRSFGCPLDGCGVAPPPSPAPACSDESGVPIEVDGEWTLDLGSEFPGADGAVSTQSGRLTLHYDFTGGGNYVAAAQSVPSPGEVAGLRLDARTPPGARVLVRLVDVEGETHQYAIARGLAADPARSERLSLLFDAPHASWGGDGIVDLGAAGDTLSLALLAHRALDRRSKPDHQYVTESLYDAYGAGQIDFHNIEWMESAAVVVDPDAVEFFPTDASGSGLMDGLGVQVHHLDYFPLSEYNELELSGDPIEIDSTELERARQMGLSWVREDLTWAEVERVRGEYDFSRWDRLAAELELLDMKLLLILGYGNPLYIESLEPPGADHGAPVTDEARAAYAAYAEAAAAHFADAPIEVRFEVWNEANLGHFWRPAADADDYARLAEEAIAGILRGNPNARASTTGVSGMAYGFIDDYLSAEVATGFSAIGVHPYRGDAPESAAGDLLLLRDRVAAFSPTLELWDTEWGYSSAASGARGDSDGARALQARMMLRRALTSRGLGLPIAILYDLSDDAGVAGAPGEYFHQLDPLHPEHNFGLLTFDHQYKPAGSAISALGQVAGERVVDGVWGCGPAHVHALRLDGADDRVVILWTQEEAGDIEVQTARMPSRILDMYGAEIPVTDNFELRPEIGPVYLHFDQL